MARTVVGLYDDFSDAQQVVEELVHNSFRREDISLVAPDAKGEFGRNISEQGEEKDKTASGAGKGAGIGAAIGGGVGLLLGLGLLAIPGLGPVLAAGPIVSALAGAGIGAAAGGLIGALTEAGVPEEEARLYEEGVRRGGALVTVSTPDDRADLAAEIMNRYHPVDVNQRAEEWRGAGRTTGEETSYAMDHDILGAGAAPAEAASSERTSPTARTPDQDKNEVTVPVVQEELQVGKREAQKGGVRIHTRVTEQPVDETVNLRKEHVDVRHNPVDRPASDADLQTLKDETIEVVETSEEPVVEKKARVVEEVHVRKTVEEQPQKVSGKVRRKDVDVEDLDQKQGIATQDFSAYEPAYRTHFKTHYATTSHQFNDYQPAYRYGYDLFQNERYRGRTWEEIEPQVRRDWGLAHPGSAWDEFKDAIREGWDRVRGQ